MAQYHQGYPTMNAGIPPGPVAGGGDDVDGAALHKFVVQHSAPMYVVGAATNAAQAAGVTMVYTVTTFPALVLVQPVDVSLAVHV